MNIKNIIQKVAAFTTAFMLLALPFVAYGQIKNPTKFNTPYEVLDAFLYIIKAITFAGFPLALGYLMVKGQAASAKGDTTSIDKYKVAALWLCIWTAGVFASQIIGAALRNTANEITY